MHEEYPNHFGVIKWMVSVAEFLRMNCSCPEGKNGLGCIKVYSCNKEVESATIW